VTYTSLGYLAEAELKEFEKSIKKSKELSPKQKGKGWQ
jgi:hypothetical protein